MSFAQSSATVILVYCPPLRSIFSVGNCRGAVQGWGRGSCVWSQQQRGWGNLGSAWKYNCRGCRLWWGAEPKHNREPCPSWLPVVGAGEGTGTPLVHCWQCLAALRLPQRWGHGRSCCLWELVSLPKGEMCVGCFTSSGLSLMSVAARARAVLSLGWSFSSLQPASSPGCSCPSLLTCFKSFAASMLRC